MIDCCHCGHLAQTHAHPGHAGCRSPECGCAAFESEDAPVQESLLEVLSGFLPAAVPVAGVLVPLEPQSGLESVRSVTRVPMYLPPLSRHTPAASGGTVRLFRHCPGQCPTLESAPAS